MRILLRLYDLILILLLPVFVIRLYIKSIKNPAYRQRILERFGFNSSVNENKNINKDIIWIHAVSVGEVVASIPLAKKLIESNPGILIIYTTTTPTGAERVKSFFGGGVFSGKVFHRYLPFDLSFSIKKFIKNISPKCLIIIETEIWPNLIFETNKQSVPVFLINARLSEKSFEGYSKIKRFITSILKSFKHIFARGMKDMERFKMLGIDESKISVSGNIKYDLQLPEDFNEKKGAFVNGELANGKIVIVAASTHEGEEKLIIDAFKKIRDQRKDVLLVIVPRHPERFNSVARLIESYGIIFSKRSEVGFKENTEILLGDSMGEMFLYFSIADLVIMGGSFEPIGGHNPLEAMLLGVPVVCGKYMHNFEELADEISNSQCGVVLKDNRELFDAVENLINNKEKRGFMGQKGRQFLDANGGVVERIANEINNTIK